MLELIMMIIDKVCFLLRFQLIFAALMSIEIIYPLFVDGPFREIFTGMRSKFCQKNYYYSLLHITNLVDSPAEIVSLPIDELVIIIILLNVFLVYSPYMDLFGGISNAHCNFVYILYTKFEQKNCNYIIRNFVFCNVSLYTFRLLL